jgi:glc operon protein GlcG
MARQRILSILLAAAVVMAAPPFSFIARAQEKPPEGGAPTAAPRERPRIDAATSLSLEEARIIIEAAVARVRADKAHAAIAVVDDNGNLVSMDRVDGTSSFFQRFAVGKAVGAVALQQTTAESAEQYKTNPQRFLSALSMLQGEILLIRGGFPLIVDGRIVGGVGSAGHRGDGDVEAVKAGIAAWERYRETRSR